MTNRIPALALLTVAACANTSADIPPPPAEVFIEEASTFTDSETGQEYFCVTTTTNLTECTPTGPTPPAP
jgi:hypothetical protein